MRMRPFIFPFLSFPVCVLYVQMSTGVIKCKEACGVSVSLLAQKDFLKEKDTCGVTKDANLKSSLPGTSPLGTDQLVNGQHVTLIDCLRAASQDTMYVH